MHIFACTNHHFFQYSFTSYWEATFVWLFFFFCLCWKFLMLKFYVHRERLLFIFTDWLLDECWIWHSTIEYLNSNALSWIQCMYSSRSSWFFIGIICVLNKFLNKELKMIFCLRFWADYCELPAFCIWLEFYLYADFLLFFMRNHLKS